MTDFRSIVSSVESLAHMAAAFVPGAGMVEAGAKISGKVLDLVDAVSEHADPADQARLQAARKELAAKVTAHANSTADDLRG